MRDLIVELRFIELAGIRHKLKCGVEPYKLALFKFAVFFSLRIVVGAAPNVEGIYSPEGHFGLSGIKAAAFTCKDLIFVLAVNFWALRVRLG
jgi:hypothetical protein